jgi:hypothetical protein
MEVLQLALQPSGLLRELTKDFLVTSKHKKLTVTWSVLTRDFVTAPLASAYASTVTRGARARGPCVPTLAQAMGSAATSSMCP